MNLISSEGSVYNFLASKPDCSSSFRFAMLFSILLLHGRNSQPSPGPSTMLLASMTALRGALEINSSKGSPIIRDVVVICCCWFVLFFLTWDLVCEVGRDTASDRQKWLAESARRTTSSPLFEPLASHKPHHLTRLARKVVQLRARFASRYHILETLTVHVFQGPWFNSSGQIATLPRVFSMYV